jgi:lysine 2,3-aminomutase
MPRHHHRPAPRPPVRAAPRTAEALVQAGLHEDPALPAAEQVARRYAVAVTPHLAELMAGRPTIRPPPVHPGRRGAGEAREELGDHGDDAHAPVKGIVHRYRDRC